MQRLTTPNTLFNDTNGIRCQGHAHPAHEGDGCSQQAVAKTVYAVALQHPLFTGVTRISAVIHNDVSTRVSHTWVQVIPGRGQHGQARQRIKRSVGSV